MGKLTVVGIGPGNAENLTLLADQVLARCEVIVGYQVYVDLVKGRYPDKEYITTAMTREMDRCRMEMCIRDSPGARRRTQPGGL